jgi:hypothetical protein
VHVLLSEVGATEAALVLKAYLTSIPVTRPFFDVRADAPLVDFEQEASQHPVFRLGLRERG